VDLTGGTRYVVEVAVALAAALLTLAVLRADLRILVACRPHRGTPEAGGVRAR
jgi:hypothetical protein